MTRYFSASICYGASEGGWTYYVAAEDREGAEDALAAYFCGQPHGPTQWEERQADEVVTVDRESGADHDQIALGTFKPGEVKCFTW